MGEERRCYLLRSAGLQAISAMVWFMGEHSHISMDFDDIVAVTLDNYKLLPMDNDDQTSDNFDDHWGQVHKGEGHIEAMAGAIRRVPSWKEVWNFKGEINLTREETEDPKVWSKVCLQNMAKLAKEATTVRRVLEPMFRIFDTGKHWSPQHGLALCILYDMQQLMERSGHSTHLLLSMLIKHLDHKNVVSQPQMQINIVEITAVLAQQSKSPSSVAIVGAISDLARHLRKSMHCSSEASNLSDDINNWNKSFQATIEECLVQLAKRVGDAGPILDMMAVTLENLSTTTIVARTTIAAVYLIANIISSIPNRSYHNKAFPEALFHQLLQAMMHPDLETRVRAHRTFTVVLVASSVTARPGSRSPESPRVHGLKRTLSRNASVLSSASAFFEKLRKEKVFFQEIRGKEDFQGKDMKDNQKMQKVGFTDREEAAPRRDTDVKHCTVHPIPSQTHSLKLPGVCSITDGNFSSEILQNAEMGSLRLSGHQMALLLSSLWAQATSLENTPTNFEAIGNTYNLALLFSRVKTSSHSTLIRSFQLALTLRSIALDQDCYLRPCHRRSLFTLATTMLVFAAKTYNCSALVMHVKARLTDKTIDPFLQLIDDNRLRAVNSTLGDKIALYGSSEDNTAALEFLSAVTITEDLSTESLVSLIISNLGSLSETEASTMRKELLQSFSPDDAFALGAQLYMETPRPCSPFASQENSSFPEMAPPTEEDLVNELFGSQANTKDHFSKDAKHVLSVNQLLESVLDTARHVASSISTSATPVPYSQMASQCEALVIGKQKKMSVVMSFKRNPDPLLLPAPEKNDLSGLIVYEADQDLQKIKNNSLNGQKLAIDAGNPEWFSITSSLLHSSSQECQHSWQSFRLPPASPYDNFLKAARY
jgi:hypothetical protein